jgi:hypothetical protein
LVLAPHQLRDISIFRELSCRRMIEMLTSCARAHGAHGGNGFGANVVIGFLLYSLVGVFSAC